MKAIFASRSMIPVTGTINEIALRAVPASVSSAVGGAAGFVERRIGNAVEAMFTWQRRVADRRSLETLDDRMLQDIGLTRGEVFVEAGKPFWKA